MNWADYVTRQEQAADHNKYIDKIRLKALKIKLEASRGAYPSMACKPGSFTDIFDKEKTCPALEQIEESLNDGATISANGKVELGLNSLKNMYFNFSEPTETKTKKEKIMKKLMRNIMMLCTGLCFARLMVFLHPLVAMIPVEDNSGDPLPVFFKWFLVLAVCTGIFMVTILFKLILSSIYGWIFS